MIEHLQDHVYVFMWEGEALQFSIKDGDVGVSPRLLQALNYSKSLQNDFNNELVKFLLSRNLTLL